MFFEFRKNSFALFYSILTIVIAVTFFDVVFDDSYDSFTSNISAFQFTSFSMFDQHYLGILLIRDVLKFLQGLLPEINIFSSFYILSNIISLVYTLTTLKKVILKFRIIEYFGHIRCISRRRNKNICL